MGVSWCWTVTNHIQQTRYVANFTLNLHPLYQPAHHWHTSPSAPNNTCTTHPSHQTGTTHASVHPLPIHQTWKTHDTNNRPTPRHTHLYMTFAYTHEIPPRFTTQYHTKKTLKLISNFPPLVTAQHTTCSNIRLVRLKMGIMMPETC